MSRPRPENFKTWNTREVGVIVRRNRPTKRERCRGYLQIPDANCKTGAGDIELQLRKHTCGRQVEDQDWNLHEDAFDERGAAGAT